MAYRKSNLRSQNKMDQPPSGSKPLRDEKRNNTRVRRSEQKDELRQAIEEKDSKLSEYEDELPFTD